MEESELLDTNILINGKYGLTTILNIIEHPIAIEKCEIIWPDKIDFNLAIDLALRLRLAGTPLGCVDILISSICINRDLILKTKDQGFRYIKNIEDKFKVRIIEDKN